MIKNISEDLFYGIQVSDCLLPCLRTTATVRKKMTTTMPPEFVNGRTTLVSLNFDNEVRVRKTSVDRFSFLVSLNFFGSNLGLWGVLGLHLILEWTAIVNKTCKALWNNVDTYVHIMDTSFAMSAKILEDIIGFIISEFMC